MPKEIDSHLPSEERVQKQILENPDQGDYDQEPVEDKTNDLSSTNINILGVFEPHPDGYGFLRIDGYASSENDCYVSPLHIRRFHLKQGDMISGIARIHGDRDKYAPLIYIHEINGRSPKRMWERVHFEDLTPIYPNERLSVETESGELTTRLIDLMAPIGKGQRGLIVSPPKAGKTTLIKLLAKAIETHHPEVKVMVLLIDERPEEVTDIRRSVKGEVIASTFDESPDNHIRLAEFAVERAKRLVEEKEDVVILLDSITRLSRAYNLLCPPSGKTLSGGLDPMALHGPKRFFGAARNVEEGGSLTILASALVDTGSRMDDMIFEEFKGTGNMEIILDRKMSELRVFPAIDIFKSGTRRDDLLLTQDELKTMLALRRMSETASPMDFLDTLRKLLSKWKTNADLVNYLIKQMKKS